MDEAATATTTTAAAVEAAVRIIGVVTDVAIGGEAGGAVATCTA
jgi:hypothetical protein